MKYCTRKNVHVDRCSTAWLIKRFIDPAAEFVFVEGHNPAPDTIPFDIHRAEWGHHGNRCSFETVAAIHGLDRDQAIAQIGRIIHGADIKADADETLESAGIDLVFRGMRLIARDDLDAIERGCEVMDALYAALKRGDE